MFYDDYGKHHKKHIHVKYNGQEAVYDFKGNILDGKMPNKQRKLIEAWISIHEEELESLWNFMNEQGEFFKIEPLK